MTKPIDPYSRVYWRVLNDERFDDIRADVRHFGSWTLMLLVADMAYPAPAFVPPTVPKASLRILTHSGLVEPLPGGLFRLHGLLAERERRSPRGSGPDPDGTPTGPRPVPVGTLARAGVDETRQDEQRQDQTSPTARAGLPNLDATAIGLLERVTGRPWSLAGDKQLGELDRLLGDHGYVAVETALEAVAKGETLTARQVIWPAMKLLEPMPSLGDQREADRASASEKRAHRIAEQMHGRRVERFRFTGEWDEAWGPAPESVAS